MTHISAIIPAYNCAPYLRRAVDSLLATGEPELEIIIVDDGSTDNTLDVIRALIREHPETVSLRQHPQGANLGVSATRNLGIGHSTGEFICFLDGDDYVFPHRFRRSLPLLRDDLSIDAVYELTRIESATAKPLERCFGDTGIFGITHPVEPQHLLSMLLSGPIWHANSVLIRKSFLARTGDFRVDYQTAEDCHLWYRMAATGRVVAGEFVDPVSTYCRREGSLFRPSWESRCQLMRAMGDFAQWLRTTNAPKAVRREAYRGITQYLNRTITEARRAGNADVAREVAWQAVRCFPPLIRRSSFWRQTAHILLSPVRTDPISSGISLYDDETSFAQTHSVVNPMATGSDDSGSHRTAANRISAIIPAYNCAPYLRRAVESLLATRQPGLEVVIVDDGSQDDTLRIAQSLAEQFRDTIAVFHHPQRAHRGVSVTRNVGILQSSGDYLCFLDADDYVFPHRFESAIKILQNRPEVDGVHELAEMAFESAEASSHWYPNGSSHFGFTQDIPPQHLLASLLRGVCWATSAILFRKSLLSKTGLFDTTLEIAEDCHFWFRLAFTGNLVSGDLSRPVSAYWRREQSAFRPDPTNRLPMIRAMATFRTWAAAHGAGAEKLKEIDRNINEYILQGLVVARQAKQRKLAWKIAWLAYWNMPDLVHNRLFRGHLARMAVGR